MNMKTNIISSAVSPEPVANPADDVNHAKAIVLTVWMALHSSEFDGCEGDCSAVSNTLYEAFIRLDRAEKAMGVYHD